MKMASPIKESFDENDHVDVGIKTQGILKTDEDFIPQGDSRIEDGIGQLPLDNAKTTDNMEPENQGELESGGESKLTVIYKEHILVTQNSLVDLVKSPLY